MKMDSTPEAIESNPFIWLIRKKSINEKARNKINNAKTIFLGDFKGTA